MDRFIRCQAEQPSDHSVEEVIVESTVRAYEPILPGSVTTSTDGADAAAVVALDAGHLLLRDAGEKGAALRSLVASSIGVIGDRWKHPMAKPLGNVRSKKLAFCAAASRPCHATIRFTSSPWEPMKGVGRRRNGSSS